MVPMKMSTWFPRFILVVLVPSGFAQDAVWKYPCPTNEIARYTA